MLECASEFVVKMLFCQTMSRACLVLQALILQLTQTSAVLRNKLASRLVSLLQSLAPNLTLCRQVCGELSRDVSISFWAQCDSTVDQVLTLIAGTGTLQRINSDKRSIRTAGEYVVLPQQNVAGSLAMKMTSMNRIRHALILTIPTPQELFMEICRLKNANPRNATISFAYDGVDDDIDNNGYYDVVEGDICGLIFLRLKHAISGFQFLLRLGTVDAKDFKLSMPNIDDWVSSLAESLFLVLSTFSEGKNAMMSIQAFEFLIDLAPILCESFFHLYVGSDLTSHYDWIFWEMTKRMSNFVEVSKHNIKQFRSVQPTSKLQSSSNRANLSSSHNLHGILNSTNSTEENNNSIKDAFHSARSHDDTSRTDKSAFNMSHTPVINASRKSSPAAFDTLTGRSSPTKVIHVPMTSMGINSYSNNSSASTIVALGLNPESGRAKGRLPPLGLTSVANSTNANGSLGSSSGSAPSMVVPSIVLPSSLHSQSQQQLSLPTDEQGLGTSASDNSNITKPKKKKYTGRHVVNMDSLKAPLLVTSQSEASLSSKLNANDIPEFCVSQLVDGLVELSNGSKRWYPGRITAVHSNRTYDIAFEDGDCQFAKTAGEIRLSKKTKTISNVVSEPVVRPMDTQVSPAEVLINRPDQAGKQFNVEQRVDGLYQLSNGSKRWFPGVILAVAEGKYDIRYDDGEVQYSKTAEEIRNSRRALDTKDSVIKVPPAVELPKETSSVAVEAANPTGSSQKSDLFGVGTKVDGLVQLISGKSRWFSGIVENVNVDGTFDVRYDDGDTQVRKPHTDLRHSKKLSRNVVKNKEPAISHADQSVANTARTKKALNSMLIDVEELSSKLLTYSKSNSRSSEAAGVSTSVSDKIGEVVVTLQADGKFAVEDCVDGLVKLSNGTTRWFPGKIARVNADETYDVSYLDGDYHSSKTDGEIRVSKRTNVSGEEPAGQGQPVRNSRSPVPNILSGQLKQMPAAMSPSSVTSGSQAFGFSTGRAQALTPQLFSVGEVVECLYSDSSRGDITEKWIQGRIVAINLDGTYDVDYSDGDFQKYKSAKEIRSLRSPASSGRRSSRPTTERSSVSSQKSAASPRSLSCYNVCEDAHSRPAVAMMAALSSIKSQEDEDGNLVHDEGSEVDQNISLVGDHGVGDGQEANLTAEVSLGGKVEVVDVDDEGGGDDDDSDDDSEHGFFEIPSIFANGHVRCESRGMVPSVSLSKAKFPSSNSIGPAAQSLSAALNYDAMSDCASEKGGKYSVNAFLNENTGNYLDSGNNGSNSVVKPRMSFNNNDDDVSNITMKTSSAGGVQRMMSWRERKEDTSGICVDYRRLSGRSTTSNNGISYGGASAFNTFRGNNSNALSELDGNNIADSVMLDLPLNLLNQDDSEEYIIPDVLLRSYNIICIILLKRCIVDKYFLDHACCSSRVISHASHMHFTSSGVGMSSKNYDSSLVMSSHNTGRPLSVRSGRPTSRPSSARSNTNSESLGGGPHVPLKHINLLFNLREYLEFIPSISDNFFYLGELANAMGPCYSRILKLLHSHYFQCCLPMHISSAEKVGEGGFGSIFRITCPDLCGEVNSKRRFLNPLRKITRKDITPCGAECRMPIENRSNWKHCNCKASVHSPVVVQECPDVTMVSAGASVISKKRDGEGTLSRFGSDASLVDGIQYAVKRIPRERSVHDNQVLSAIYNEVTSLAALEGLIGVCQLLDYGVFLSEYWLVMELGGKNLSEWRRRAIDAEESDVSPLHKPPQTQSLYSRVNSEVSSAVGDLSSHNFSKEILSISDCCMCLTMFVDILFIVRAVHAADVGHFDIKCNNFVLKHETKDHHLSTARNMHDSFDSSQDTHLQQAGVGVNAKGLSSKLHPGVLADVRSLREAHDKKKPSGQIILIDFGEAMPYMSAIKSRSTVASTSAKCRGTLCIQSPEIISISSNATMNNAKNKVGASAPKFPLPNKQSDIWSLGCLLVELLTGDYLFAERQWADLYVTLARTPFDDKTIPLQTLRHSLSALPEDIRSSIETLVRRILVQMPADRPTIDEMIRMTNNILGNYLFAPLFRNTAGGGSTLQRPVSGHSENHLNANNSGNGMGLSGLSGSLCRSADLDTLRKREFESVKHLTVQLTDTVITLSDSVIFQVETPCSVPILLSTVYAVPKSDEGESHYTERKTTSLLQTAINSELLKTDLEACLLSRYEHMDTVINTASLNRVVKDVSSRLLRSWALQNSMVQIIVASSRKRKIELYKQMTQYGVRNAIYMVVVSPEEESLDDLLPNVSRVFTQACNALSNHHRVVVTVAPLDDDGTCTAMQSPPSCKQPDTDGNDLANVEAANYPDCVTFPTFSKLAVSIAFAIADGLSIWSNAGSGRRKEPGKYLVDPNVYEQATTSHGIGNYAPDIENACCRRVIDVVLEYVDRDADCQLCYQEKPK
jgi:hypothetical protein